MFLRGGGIYVLKVHRGTQAVKTQLVGKSIAKKKDIEHIVAEYYKYRKYFELNLAKWLQL